MIQILIEIKNVYRLDNMTISCYNIICVSQGLTNSREDKDMPILFLVYIALGWWAANRTIYANKITIGAWNAIFFQKFMVAFFLGWLLIPIALIKVIFGK